MEAAYFNAAIPEPYRILGLRLKPFSLGRYLLLKRFGCAFVADGDATAGISDLLLGLVVCSMRVDDFLAALSGGTLAKDIRRWGRKVCPCAWVGCLPIVGKWWRGRHSFNVLDKIALFREYIEEGSRVPAYWDEAQESKASGAHWSHAMEVALRGAIGWTSEDVNEAPLSKAFSDYFKHAENLGLVRLMSPDEEAAAAL